MADFDVNAQALRVLMVAADGSALVTSTNPAVTQQGNADDQSATDRGLLTNGRLYGYDGTAWDRVLTASGALRVVQYSPGQSAVSVGTSNADGVAVSAIAALSNADNWLFNGATWDRQRSNTEGVALATSDRTATAVSPIIPNHNGRALFALLIVNTAGTGNLTLRARQYADAAGTGLPTNLGAFNTGITATGRYGLMIAPGITPANIGASGTVQQVAAQVFRSFVVEVVPSDGSTWNYSVLYAIGL